jgi:hypothetical protein
MATNQLLIEARNKCLDNLHETIGRLHSLTVSAPSDAQWDEVREVVCCPDSIADVMRKALDAMEDDVSSGIGVCRRHFRYGNRKGRQAGAETGFHQIGVHLGGQGCMANKRSAVS